jgi:hypothetical protein
VESTAAGTSTQIIAGHGSDVFNISPTDMNLGNIRGSLHIDGGSGASRIIMFDAHTTDNYTVHWDRTTVQGLGSTFDFTYEHVAAFDLFTHADSVVPDDIDLCWYDWQTGEWRCTQYLTVHAI